MYISLTIKTAEKIFYHYYYYKINCEEGEAKI